MRLGSVDAMSWFTTKKLTLLAPFGVGTVDQTFLSVLHARHSRITIVRTLPEGDYFR
ncbi:MAG: hypothetical protein AB9907_08355 [Flexilinea sp.]